MLSDTYPDAVKPFYEALPPAAQRAADILVALNRSADPDFKRKYARRWWEILQARAGLCARMSASLWEFASCLSSRLGGAIGRTPADTADLAPLLRGEGEDEVLDTIIRQTPVLIAFVRQVSDAQRERYERMQQEIALGPEAEL